MKTSLSSITNLSISPRGRKLPVSIYEFVATVLSEYALSNLKVDSNDSAFHSISSYFVGGEILAKDLIQKLLIIPEIASIFDCFPSMGNGKEYDYAVWSQFLSDTTWEYDGKSSVFVFKEHTYAMENKVLILEKEPDGLFAKRLHCEATEQYYGRIGPGAREDKTAIQTPPIFTPRPQEVTLQDKDVEKAVSDADFFTLDESLQGADPQQREAITSGIDKNLIILAGAGSGKTRTLVARLAYLRAVKKIPLNRILLLTFTVAAAAEMRSRGKSLVDVIYSNIAPTKKSTVNARTIDSFVIQLVNTYYPQMGFSQKPVIYYSDNVETKQQKIQMLSEIIRENKLEGIFRFYLAGAGTQPEKLGRLLSDLIDYARGLPINCAGFDFLLQQYQEHQRASGKIMGFTEASLFVRDAIMQEDSPVKKGIIGKYSCILIDEFQDVNVLQNSIFEPFYDVGSINFTFVGDDDQSIYYWRGSDNTIIKNLIGKPNCKTTYLLTNYRNNPNIVEAGNAILSTIQNRAKKGKPIRANRATGEKIRVTTYNSKFTNLVNEINILLASGKSADEICILSRDRRTANSIRDELTAADIAVSKEDSIIVLSDMYREMKAILSILNAYNITASAKELRLITQSVNVTERHIQKIVKGRCTEVECEDSLKKVKALSDEVRLNQITSLADAVDRFSIKAGELYEGRVNEHHSDEVFEQFEEYCQNTSAPWPVPRAQLKEIFSTFEDNAKKRAVSGKPLTPGVRISTIHSAKGLEYDIVIITGLSAGQYPNTEQIDRKYAERNEQLKTFQESRACYYRQKQELDQSVFPTLLEECDSPIFTEAERDRMQDFQQELFDMRDGLLTLSADGVEEYLDAYVYFMTPLIAQYSSDIAKLNTELLNKQSEAEEMKEQILVATSDTAEDESNYNSQLEELCKSIADIGESIERLKIKRNRFFEATANLNNFYVQCLTVKGLLADMARADEIEELQQELKVEREQRTNEERRLFYVAVTRARDYLYLCYEAGTQPSEFIRLIPEKLKAEHIMMTLEEERDYRRIAIGIDVSKGKSTVCGMKPGGEIVYTPFEVQHTREGMSELVSLLHNSGEEVRAVLESTGSYHCPVVAALLENGIFVSVINSLRMKRFCSQSIRKVKTDRIDAMQIALYGLAYWQELQPTRLPEDTYRELQLLARQYYQMTSILIKAKVDFNAICDQVLPGMQELMNDHAGRHKLSDFVLQYCHTTHILEMGETRFRKDYCKWAEKKGYRNCERMAMLIFATAQNGIPVLPNAPSTQIVITEAIRVLHTVEASRDAILTQMQALAKTLPEYSLVREMPCIGDTLAPRLIAEIGDVRRFHSKRALIAYAGIDAPPYQSGKFCANNRHISKRGNRYLRKTGYEVMQSYVMHKPANDPIFTFIEKKRGEGKSGKLAMVAGLNKFLRVYYGKVTELYRSLSAIE